MNFLLHLMPEGRWEPAWDDEIVRSTLVARDGDHRAPPGADVSPRGGLHP